MARLTLRDECVPVRSPVVVGLDGDCPVVPSDGEVTSVWPVLAVRLRSRVGYDDVGAPVFTWTTVLEAESLLWESREEFDAEAGVTMIKARAMVPNPEGLAGLPESAVVQEPGTGTMWRITSTSTLPDRIEMELNRVEQDRTVTP